MQRAAVGVRGDVGIASSGTARTEWIAAPTVRVSSGRIRRREWPGVGVVVAEPALGALERGVDAARQVGRVEQGDPQAGVAGGRAQGLGHDVRVVVRGAVRAVVQVVELADRRTPARTISA